MTSVGCAGSYMRGTSAPVFSSVCDAAVEMLGMKAALVAVLTLVGTAMSQYQSFYAGGGWSYPGPLPQFAAANSEEGLENRVGATTTTTQSPEQFISSQVGAWPEDRQPFWFVNREHIQQHLGRPQPQGFPQGQGTQRQPQNQPNTQTQRPDAQRQPQNQPDSQTQPQSQPQDLPNTRSRTPVTQTEIRKQPEIGSQTEDNQSQVQNQLEADRQYQLWLQNQFFARRPQQWSAQNQPGIQTQIAQEPLRWRGRPGTKTIYGRQ
ncbi:activating signal cointegrator 1 complex subunit 2 homolog [Schistocerca serialis cubense]|uniref:activating signal cointegrator 1 complex subunit 2 homolog n=1 Tax=Schistocerca serialis cubense TaxID=2023355 RepID=UPI00214F20B0|nr:activating signal cointegrator 1 complex subunit 2 homolog [Schistocerca serialis cubense]